MLPETTQTDWMTTPWSYVVPLYKSTKTVYQEYPDLPSKYFRRICTPKPFALQAFSTFLYCYTTIVIILSFSKIIWSYVNFHLLVLFNWLVLHLFLTAPIRKNFTSDQTLQIPLLNPKNINLCEFEWRIYATKSQYGKYDRWAKGHWVRSVLYIL